MGEPSRNARASLHGTFGTLRRAFPTKRRLGTLRRAFPTKRTTKRTQGYTMMECLVSMTVLTAVLGLTGVLFSLRVYKQVHSLNRASNETVMVTDFVRQFRRDVREAEEFTLVSPRRIVVKGAERKVIYTVSRAKDGVVTVTRWGGKSMDLKWWIAGTISFAVERQGTSNLAVAKVRYRDKACGQMVELKVVETPK